MKKILLLISTAAMLSACQREIPLNGDTAVEIRLLTGSDIGGDARTRAGDVGEADIETVNVLVFERDQSFPDDPTKAIFKYSRYAWHKGSSIYSVVLKEGTNVDLYFVINARKTLADAESENKLVENATTWTEAQKALVLSGDITRKTTGLPMWGHRFGENISTNSAANKFGTVKVLRAVATADVDFTAADNFILQQASVEFASNQGYLAFAVNQANITHGGAVGFSYDKPQHDYQLLAPEVPAGTTTTKQILHVLPTRYSVNPAAYPDNDGTTSNNVEGELYFYENDANGENGKNYTKVVVKGIWDQNTPSDTSDDEESFYPLAFREKTIYRNPENPNDPMNGSNLRVDVIRNHKYKFRVTGVNGNGYASLNEARNGTDMNITYDVIEWAQWDDLEIIMVEKMWVSLSKSRNEDLSKIATLYRNAGSTDEIAFTTNIPFDKHKITIKDGAAITPESEGATQEEWAAQGIVAKVANALFTVTLVTNGTPTVNNTGETVYYGKYIFEAKLPYASSNVSTLRVVADLIGFDLNILQRDATPDDWEDGSDTDAHLEGRDLID